MNRTIAFDNKKGVWKTRYSFFSSCIAWVKNIMVTAPISNSTGQLIWKHDGSSPDNNRFYAGAATPSLIGVSFNDKPSANKQFKSLSVETLNPNSITSGLNIFNINGNSGSVGILKQKGGILYGHIGNESNVTISNFEFIGVIKEIYSSAEAVELATGLSMEDITGTSFIEFEHVEMSSLSSGAALLTNDPQGVKDGTTAGLPLPSGNPVMYQGILITNDVSGLTNGDGLYFAYNSNINGEAPKGQFADVTITLGSEDFEVQAVNLEYSTTNLDHSN